MLIKSPLIDGQKMRLKVVSERFRLLTIAPFSQGGSTFIQLDLAYLDGTFSSSLKGGDRPFQNLWIFGNWALRNFGAETS
jgi:hypothetical protein